MSQPCVSPQGMTEALVLQASLPHIPPHNPKKPPLKPPWLPFEDSSLCLGVYSEAECFLHSAVHHGLRYLVRALCVLLPV